MSTLVFEGQRQRRVRKSVAAAALAIVALGGAAGASPALAGSSLCPSSRVCIYTDSDFVGLLGYRAAGGGIVNLSSGADNKMDSWENKTSTNGAWYDDPGGSGHCNNMLANRENKYVGLLSRNGMSSWKTNGSC